MKGILLINLGSPNDLSSSSIKNFLTEFLSDDLVVDYPKFIQQPLVRGIIVPFRYKNTQSAYKEVWTENGSPLILTTRNLAQELSNETSLPVEIAMRYQNPSIREGLGALANRGCTKIKVVPLYPHFAISTTLTTKLKVKEELTKMDMDIEVEYIDSFFDSNLYIQALSSIIKENMDPESDLLLFSYHGIPKRHLKKATKERNHSEELCIDSKCNIKDFCYRHQVMETSRLCAEELGLEEGKWMVSFQSRVGPGWLEPFTDKVLEKLPSEGIKNISVVSPSFVSDNLETLEEVNIEGRETFLESGGEKFSYVPCLNTDKSWVNFLASIV